GREATAHGIAICRMTASPVRSYQGLLVSCNNALCSPAPRRSTIQSLLPTRSTSRCSSTTSNQETHSHRNVDRILPGLNRRRQLGRGGEYRQCQATTWSGLRGGRYFSLP